MQWATTPAVAGAPPSGDANAAAHDTPHQTYLRVSEESVRSAVAASDRRSAELLFAKLRCLKTLSALDSLKEIAAPSPRNRRV